MHMNISKLAGKGFVAVLLLLAGAIAMAQQGTITLDHKAEQWESYTDNTGAEQQRLVPAARVVPGENIVFTVTYSNNGDQPAENITITNPVPEHMDYVDGSASGDSTTITFSVDGGNEFAAAGELTVAAEDGSQRPAGAVDYTHVRWVVSSDVAPGTNGTVQFTAVVE